MNWKESGEFSIGLSTCGGPGASGKGEEIKTRFRVCTSSAWLIMVGGLYFPTRQVDRWSSSRMVSTAAVTPVAKILGDNLKPPFGSNHIFM
jgi:hypothetical protein